MFAMTRENICFVVKSESTGVHNYVENDGKRNNSKIRCFSLQSIPYRQTGTAHVDLKNITNTTTSGLRRPARFT